MIGSTGNVLPASGLGFIGANIGQPNASGGALTPPPRPVGPMPGGVFGGMSPQQQPSQPPSIGNVQPMNAGPMMRPAIQPGGVSANIGQLIGQLHPNTMNALKSIPPEALQQLHAAGLIHPHLMGHLRSGGVNNSGGAMY